MAKIIQNNFSAGEISPLLYARSDLQAYYTGCAKAENFVVTKEGTLRKRNGFGSIYQIPNDTSGFRWMWKAIDHVPGSAGERGYFVLCGTNIICTYYDDDFSRRTIVGINGQWSCICHNSDMIVVASTDNKSARSLDGGVNWEVSNTSSQAEDIFIFQGSFLIPGSTPKTSSDGFTWTNLSDGPNGNRSAANDRSAIVIPYGTKYYRYFSSIDTWITNSADAEFTGVAVHNNTWVATSRNGKIFYREEYQPSYLIGVSVAGQWLGVKWCGDVFVAWSADKIAFSSDGSTWVTKDHANDFRMICPYSGRNSIAIEENGRDIRRIEIDTDFNIDDTSVIPSISNAQFKIIPYKFDRTNGGFILIVDTIAYFFDKTGTIHTGQPDTDDHGVSCLYIKSMVESVKDIQYKQIGDEIWMSNADWFGIIKITDNAVMSYRDWQNSEKPQMIANAGTSTLSGTSWNVIKYGSGSGASTRTLFYGCVAVKNSVNSEVSKYSMTNFPVTWEAGIYNEISVRIDAADIAKFDSVIVAKRTGSAYGILAQFYMTDTPWGRYDTNGSQCYLHDDGNYYSAETGGTRVTLGYITFKFRDENHTPTDLVYEQTNTLGHGFKRPLCVDCFQQRRLFANAEIDGENFPMTMWFSEVGNLDNFWSDRPTEADDPFSPTISSTGPAFIRYTIAFAETMIVFTDNGIFSVGFTQTSGFSGSTCRISKFSDISVCDSIQPVANESCIVFVGADRKTIYTIVNSVQDGGLSVVNRSTMVEHMTRNSPVVSMASQTYPDNVIWFALADGTMLTMTFNKGENICAWSRHAIPGAKVMDIIGIGTCTDSTSGRTKSDLAMIVEIGTNRYIALQTNTYADTMAGTSSNVSANMTTLRPESKEQTIAGIKKNIKDVSLRIYNSGKLKVCPADEGGVVQEVGYAQTGNASGFTGDVKVMPRGFVNEDGQISIVSDDGSPCEILNIVTKLEIA